MAKNTLVWVLLICMLALVLTACTDPKQSDGESFDTKEIDLASDTSTTESKEDPTTDGAEDPTDDEVTTDSSVTMEDYMNDNHWTPNY